LACANLPKGNRQAPSQNNAQQIPATERSVLPSWNYAEYDDEMGRGKVYQASIESTNTISLDSPYDGEQHGTLLIRDHPEYGKDVILTIERGQLLDSDFNSKVVVRFDGDKPMSFPSVRPADLSSDALFLRGRAFAIFLAHLKSASAYISSGQSGFCF
jgi:hypothetical protein